MPRQKRQAQQLDAAKRQCLTWNMYDVAEGQGDGPSTSGHTGGRNMLDAVIVFGDEIPMGQEQTINNDTSLPTSNPDAHERLEYQKGIPQTGVNSALITEDALPMGHAESVCRIGHLLSPNDTTNEEVTSGLHVRKDTNNHENGVPVSYASSNYDKQNIRKDNQTDNSKIVPTSTSDSNSFYTSSLSPHLISCTEYENIKRFSKYSLTVHDRIVEEEIVCRLGEIKFDVSRYRSYGKDTDAALPRILPAGKFSVIVSETPTRDTFHLVFPLTYNQENIPYRASLKPWSYLCFKATFTETNNSSQFHALGNMTSLKKGTIMKLILKEYKKGNGALMLSLCLLKGALVTPQFAAEPSGSRGRNNQVADMTKVMNWMQGFPLPDLQYLRPIQQDFNELFSCLREAHRPWYESKEAWDFQHPALIPHLRPYQSQAVKWMTEKENYKMTGEEAMGDHRDEKTDAKLHTLWQQVNNDTDEEEVYYNSQSGQFTKHKFIATPRIPGGILADEMGLGKTVEVLACILAHPRPGFSLEHLEDARTKKTGKENGSSEQTEETGVKTQEQKSLEDARTKKTDNENHIENARTKKTDKESIASEQIQETEDESPEQNSYDKMGNAKTMKEHDNTVDEAVHQSSKNDTIPSCQSCDKHTGEVETKMETSNSVDDAVDDSIEPKNSGQSLMNSILVAVNKAQSNNSVDEAIGAHSSKSETISSDQSCNKRTEEVETKMGTSNSGNDAVNERSEPKTIHSGQSLMNSILVAVTETQSNNSVDEAIGAHSSKSVTISSVQSSVSKEVETKMETCDSIDETSKQNNTSKTISSVKTTKVAKKPKEKAAAETEATPLICVSKGEFQCICGKLEVWVDSHKCVKCTKCRVWQHMACVNFDLKHGDISVYLCPHCCMALKPVISKATLIVSPTAICHQWVDEINRHINSASLRVLVYKGVKKHGFLQPRTLGNCDIVVTTYDTLRQEINYVDLPHTNSDTGRRLRHAKRYMSVPSPLPAVDWWRVCLDEAQMVECTTAKVAEMALRLTAVNRWCVTGTPIQRDLDDLYGLFLFLGVEPFWVRKWWEQMLYKPYCRGNQEPMKSVLAEVLWRSAKKDVLQQIDIPAQKEQVHWLKFSPIEEHFYKRKREDCTRDFTYVAHRLTTKTKQNPWPVEPNVKLSKLDKVTAKRLLNPLLRLRQACCHPQAVRGEFLPLQKNTMTMAELLDSLTEKTRKECEESHRQLVCALNGQAAVHLMKDETLEAIAKYREVLLSVEEQKNKLKTDSLQRLHAMHNLWELLQTKPEGVAPTTRDDSLYPQMQEIRDGYMAKADALVANSLRNYEPFQQKFTELSTDYDADDPWWLESLVWARQQGYDEELVLRIKNDLSSGAGAGTDDSLNFCNRFKDIRGLEFVLTQQLDAMEESRETCCSKIEALNVPIDQATLAQCIDCHLRPIQGKKKHSCEFCKLDRKLVEYEMRLFSFKEMDLYMNHGEGDAEYGLNRPRGTWAASQTERALRIIQVFMRQVGCDVELQEYADIHMQILEQQRKEFKPLRAVYVAIRDRVAALDELEMATMRLRLRGPDEEIDKASQPYIIEPFQLDQQWQKLLNDQIVAKHDLRRKFGQLVYLQNLAKSEDTGGTGGANPEPCPICDTDLGTSWTVLTCGHCFCKECIEVLIQRSMFCRFKCPICRTATHAKEISYVSTAKPEQEDLPDNEIRIKGSHSTKVEAVVRTLMQIRQEDPNAKALVFSTWIDVLEIISRALRDNKVEYRSISQPGHRLFQSNLMDFKQTPGITALLIPVHTGSHGLNIIEATHVLLVEPILNPASELQAVGRVHRIGQTKSTVVHRFLVRNTIEERLQSLLSENPASSSLDNASSESDTGGLALSDLRQLFTQTTRYTNVSDQGDEVEHLPSTSASNDLSRQDEVDCLPSTSE